MLTLQDVKNRFGAVVEAALAPMPRARFGDHLMSLPTEQIDHAKAVHRDLRF